MDRKEFFRFSLNYATEKGLGLVERFLPKEVDSKERPPGAHPDEKRFLELCTGCDSCMAACPVNVIMIEDLERRDPVIFSEQNPCIKCPGYPCISSCPTGALRNTLSNSG